ncbi:MAG: hypothetical protein BGO99_08690 [Nitrosospira sp. 56-18]|jgi:hypothetical protein|nr:hypothetical protein [Nitrosospira sp.]OJY12683.1 MAG: hypothetical protein BGO99_08690 [Nitrosospira sp. 56-18]
MSGRDAIEAETALGLEEESGTDLLRPLIEAASLKAQSPEPGQDAQAGVVVGELIGIADEGLVPLVLYPGQPGTAALRARTVVDVRGPHVGRSVVLMFERGDRSHPIIMGVLQEGEGWPLENQPGQVEVDADGKRMIVSAKEELVLRCGKASITLTKAGKVMIKGSYLLSRSSGVNRIKGGSVQLN